MICPCHYSFCLTTCIYALVQYLIELTDTVTVEIDHLSLFSYSLAAKLGKKCTLLDLSRRPSVASPSEPKQRCSSAPERDGGATAPESSVQRLLGEKMEEDKPEEEKKEEKDEPEKEKMEVEEAAEKVVDPSLSDSGQDEAKGWHF